MDSIPYGRQHITEEDISAVVEVLRSDYLTQGPVLPRFEEAFARYTGSRYAVAVANGTAALHLGVLALGLKPGDRVLTTPVTFAASANCVRYCGGEVEFVDIDPETWLLDLASVRKRLESKDGYNYKGIIPVDFAGRPVPMDGFRELADEFGLWILEDACHAPGSFFRDRQGTVQQCGNGTYTDLTAFSFHPVKHIATGEGGMITTNDPLLYEKLLLIRTHGITRDPATFRNSAEFASGLAPVSIQTDPATQPESGSQSQSGTQPGYPEWYMEMQELGFNYRLTDFQAALGLSQLSRAEQGLDRRREIAGLYAKAFRDRPFVIRQTGVVEGHAYHLYILEVRDRLGLYTYLRDHDIYSQIHYIPLHLMPYYRDRGWKEGDMPVAEAYYRGCISLPIYPTLENEEQNYVIETILGFYES